MTKASAMTGHAFVGKARLDPHRTLARWSVDELPFVDVIPIGGQRFLLDACVYIDQMQNRSPQVLDDLVAQRQVSHLTVAIQELMHTVGVLNPSGSRAACRGTNNTASSGRFRTACCSCRLRSSGWWC